MEIPEDFRELLRLLNSHKVEFLVVGGYALAFHGVPRYTGDIDLFVGTNSKNAQALLRALDDFGFGSVGIEEKDFTEPDSVVQIGYPPLRVDFLTGISGVDWNDAWETRIGTSLGGIPVNVISKAELIRNKKATGRRVDTGDVERLE